MKWIMTLWLSPSMNLLPIGQWLWGYCLRVCGSLPDQLITTFLLLNMSELGRQQLNLVKHPNGVYFPLWFDSLEMAFG